MDINDSRIQFYNLWSINNLLLSNTKTVSIPGYSSWVTVEDLSAYNLSEPPKVYMQRLVSGDRWVEAGALSPSGVSVSYRVTKTVLQVQDPNTASTATIRYKLMTKGMG